MDYTQARLRILPPTHRLNNTDVIEISGKFFNILGYGI
jgi:hypothetical protein